MVLHCWDSLDTVVNGDGKLDCLLVSSGMGNRLL